MIKRLLKPFFVSVVLLLMFCSAGCSVELPSILEEYEVHGSVSTRYVQVVCSFFAPEDMRIKSVEMWLNGINGKTNATTLSQGVGFFSDEASLTFYDYGNGRFANKYGIYVNDEDSKTLTDNLIRKGDKVKVVFPVFLYDEMWAFDDWAITMQATEPDGNVLSNTKLFEKASGDEFGNIPTYYLGTIPAKRIMVDDLVLEYNNV